MINKRSVNVVSFFLRKQKCLKKHKEKTIILVKRGFLLIGGCKESDSRDQMLQKPKDSHVCTSCGSGKGIKYQNMDGVKEILQNDNDC